MVTLHDAWERTKVPIVLASVLVILSLLIVVLVNPTTLTKEYAAPAITGNAIAGGACSGLHDPVCGTDGVTYGNFCLARAAGKDLRHMGSCA